MKSGPLLGPGKRNQISELTLNSARTPCEPKGKKLKQRKMFFSKAKRKVDIRSFRRNKIKVVSYAKRKFLFLRSLTSRCIIQRNMEQYAKYQGREQTQQTEQLQKELPTQKKCFTEQERRKMLFKQLKLFFFLIIYFFP